jgi:ribonuclease Z
VTNMPLEHAKNAVAQHTTPKELGRVFDLAKPGIGVGSHYTLGDAMVDVFLRAWEQPMMAQ